MRYSLLILTTTLTLLVVGGSFAAPAVATPKGFALNAIHAVKKSDPNTPTTGRIGASTGRIRSAGIEVSVPAADNGVTTIESETVLAGADTNVVAREVEGGFQLAAVITSASQRTQTYVFSGKYLEVLKSGHVLVREGSLVGEPVAVIDPAWAVDATGAKVPSRFTVAGNALTQVTSIDDHTAFPVVADPRVRMAWYGFSVDFTKAETTRISLAGSSCNVVMGFAAGIAAQAGVTAAVVVGSLSAACGGIGVLADIATDQGKCVSVKILTGLPGATAPWIATCYK